MFGFFSRRESAETLEGFSAERTLLESSPGVVRKKIGESLKTTRGEAVKEDLNLESSPHLLRHLENINNIRTGLPDSSIEPLSVERSDDDSREIISQKVDKMIEAHSKDGEATGNWGEFLRYASLARSEFPEKGAKIESIVSRCFEGEKGIKKFIETGIAEFTEEKSDVPEGGLEAARLALSVCSTEEQIQEIRGAAQQYSAENMARFRVARNERNWEEVARIGSSMRVVFPEKSKKVTKALSGGGRHLMEEDFKRSIEEGDMRKTAKFAADLRVFGAREVEVTPDIIRIED